jgi:hypothetical protein
VNAKNILMGGLLVGLPLALGACVDRAQDLVSPGQAGPDQVTSEANGKIYGMYANGYSATAYATLLNGATQVLLPPAGAAGVGGCNPTAGDTTEVAAVSLPLLGSVQALKTTIAPFPSAWGTGIRATNTTGSVSLLGGLITADAILAVAVARPNTGGLVVASTGGRFTNLRVLGTTIADNPTPNTRIDLPGIGYVMIYERLTRYSAGEAAISVAMLRVVVDVENPLGLAVGTQIIVGRTQASMRERGTPLRLSGSGYAARVTGALNLPVLGSQGLACDGTDGQLLEKATATVNVPGVLELDGLAARARGVVDADSVNGFTQSELAEVSLLGGLVSATGLRATARVEKDGSLIRKYAEGEIASLTIAGNPIDVSNLQPNTQIPLAGIGTVWLNRVIETASSIEVRLIEIVVQQQNALLPISATVRVGGASAGAAQ